MPSSFVRKAATLAVLLPLVPVAADASAKRERCIADTEALANQYKYHTALAMGQSKEPGKVESCGWRYGASTETRATDGAMAACEQRSHPGTCGIVKKWHVPGR